MQFLDLSLWQRAIRGLMAMLCQLVYPLISWLYDLFMNISKVNILTGELQPIYQRVTMILTIIMIFYVTFEFVKFVVQPDGITDKEKGAGNIIYKMIAVVVLIAFVPTIFTWAYKLQGAIVDKGIIGKVIIGDTNTEPDKFGKTFSAGILSLFYSVDASDIDEECGDIKCGTVVQMNLSTLATAGQLPYLTIGINSSKEKSTSIVGEKAEMPLINFEGFMAVLVGGFVAYILVLYCIDLGVRWAQLIFLQIVAPIPIIGYLSPKKDGIFQKWCKQCLTTYLDLFIRIALIYFVLLICSVLLDARETGNLLEGLGEISPAMETFVYIALILGVMLFAQKAPKLLGELFPKMGAASGNFGLKAGERVAPMVARTAGMALGSTRALGGFAARAINRHVRNKANNAHSIFTPEGQEEARERRKHRQHGRNMQRDLRTAQGMQSRVSDEEVTKGKEKVKNAAAAYNAAKGTPEEAKRKQELEKANSEYRQLMRRRSGITDNTLKSRHEMAEKRNDYNKAQQELERLRTSGGTQEQIAAAEKKVKQAYNEFDSASNKYQKELQKGKAEDSVGQNWASIVSSQQEIEHSKQQISKAENKLNEAIASGDPNAIKKAQSEVEQAKAKYNEKQQDLKYNNERFENVYKGKTEQIQANAEEAEWQIAKDNNEKHGSVIAAGAAGAVSGFVSGVTSGVKAQKLGEIIPKAKEGWQKDVKKIQELNKFEDSGGAIGIQGIVDRTVAKVEKTIGIDTEYAKTMMSTKPLETKIKDLDAKMVLTKDVASTVGSGEDRLKSKIYELKNTASGPIKTGLKDANGDDILATPKPNQTIGDLIREYDARATVSSSEAEAAAKRVEEAASKGVTGQALTNLKEDAQAKAKRAADDKFAVEQIKKNAARNTYTQILQHSSPETESKFDQVAVQNIKDAKSSIQLASQHPELREKVREKLIAAFSNDPKDPNKPQRLYAAFVSGNITTFDDMDDIKTAVINAENEYSRDKKDLQERKRKIETSELAQSQKAANDYNGSGK